MLNETGRERAAMQDLDAMLRGWLEQIEENDALLATLAPIGSRGCLRHRGPDDEDESFARVDRSASVVDLFDQAQDTPLVSAA